MTTTTRKRVLIGAGGIVGLLIVVFGRYLNTRAVVE